MDVRDHSRPPNGPPSSHGDDGFSDLNSGLYLEDRRILLPWNARMPQLITSCQPDSQDSQVAWETFYWAHPVVLHGLHAELLEVVLYPYGWLDSAWLWLERGQDAHSAEDAYLHALEHLTEQLGQPVDDCPCAGDGTDRMRSAWQIQTLRVNLFLHAGNEFEPWAFTCAAHIIRRETEE